MCGSGTFVIEAAEVALGLAPGRSRSFAFEQMATFQPDLWAQMKASLPAARDCALRFYGSDRDEGAVRMATENAARAGVEGVTQFTAASATTVLPPDGPAGLIICNPPYGARISNQKMLFGLYAALGAHLKEHFKGWRVGIVTSDPALAQAMKLPFAPKGPPIPHGGLKVWLFKTEALR